MTQPTVSFADQLQDRALFAVEADAALAAAWGDDAVKSERITAIQSAANAATEAASQQSFLGQSLVAEEHAFPVAMQPYIGRVINVTIDELGYGAGLDVLVIAVRDDLEAGVSIATVLRRL